MKIYARQIAPEYQESSLFLGDEFFPDNIAVFGNDEYEEHCPDFIDKVWEVLRQGELADVLENIKEWAEWYRNATEAITDYLPPEHAAHYSTRAIHALKNYVLDFSCCPCSREYVILCGVLSIVTGKKWDYQSINGRGQCDWNYIFYPANEWTDEQIKAFEIEYFNMGSEWIVDDGEFDSENDSPLNISGYSIYCTSWNEEGIQKEIADAEGIDPADVVLYAFEGWSRTAQYKEVI